MTTPEHIVVVVIEPAFNVWLSEQGLFHFPDDVVVDKRIVASNSKLKFRVQGDPPYAVRVVSDLLSVGKRAIEMFVSCQK